MQKYIIIRLFQTVVTLLILLTFIFSVVRLSGDPALLMLPENATKKDYEMMKAQLGLDKPIYIQLIVFIGNAVKGNFGLSFSSRRPVIDSIITTLPNTLKLIGVSMLFAIAISLPLGVMAAVKKGTYIDFFARIIAGLGQSLPSFWVGLIMIEIFAVQLKILPTSGMGSLKHYLMPAFNLAIFFMAGIVRLLRSSMLEVLDSEYIRMARIKGVSRRAVVWKHAFRNSLLGVVSFAGVYIAIIITGSILTETVFAWPGVGRLSYTAIINQDFPMIQAVVLLSGVAVMIASLISDILYACLDPRIRYRV